MLDVPEAVLHPAHNGVRRLHVYRLLHVIRFLLPLENSVTRGPRSVCVDVHDGKHNCDVRNMLSERAALADEENVQEDSPDCDDCVPGELGGNAGGGHSAEGLGPSGHYTLGLLRVAVRRRVMVLVVVHPLCQGIRQKVLQKLLQVQLRRRERVESAEMVDEVVEEG